MITPEQADTLIAEHLPRWPVEDVELAFAAGRVLRQAVTADRDQPPFDRVTMDGVALASRAVSGGRRSFRLQSVQAAGEAPHELSDDAHCIEIMTGAVMPAGCDAVVPVERLERDGETVRLEDDVRPAEGDFIHREGSDYRQGTVLIEPGVRLRSPELAVLASVGQASVAVTRLPRVAVISTGDELVAPEGPVLPHQIRSCNDLAIAGALSAIGLPGVRRRRLPDDPDTLREALSEALQADDLLVLSGGVSMGQFDHLPRLFDELGVQRVFHKIRQRPGKPMWFGIGPGGRPVFSLPGNPVSALVCLHRYVLPAIRTALGETVADRMTVTLEDSPEGGDWTRFLPVHRGTDNRARPVSMNTSGDFFSLCATDGLVECGPRVDAGPVPFIPWTGP